MPKDTLVLIDYALGKLGAVSENLNQLLSPEGVRSVQVTDRFAAPGEGSVTHVIDFQGFVLTVKTYKLLQPVSGSVDLMVFLVAGWHISVQSLKGASGLL